MNVTAFFTENFVPKTGLSPTISIWKIDGTLVVNAAAMTEIAGGFYKYNFAAYNETLEYVIRADGGITQPVNERYLSTANDLGVVTANETLILADTSTLISDVAAAKAVIDILHKIEKNKWTISSNRLHIYDNDGTTILYQFELQDHAGVPTMGDVFRRIPV